MENEWTKEREELLKKIEGLEAMCQKAARIIVKLKRERDTYKGMIDAVGGRG